LTNKSGKLRLQRICNGDLIGIAEIRYGELRRHSGTRRHEPEVWKGRVVEKVSWQRCAAERNNAVDVVLAAEGERVIPPQVNGIVLNVVELRGPALFEKTVFWTIGQRQSDEEIRRQTARVEERIALLITAAHLIVKLVRDGPVVSTDQRVCS